MPSSGVDAEIALNWNPGDADMLVGAGRVSAAGPGARAKVGGSHKGVAMSVYDIEEEEAGLEVEEEELSEGEAEILEMALREVV